MMAVVLRLWRQRARTLPRAKLFRDMAVAFSSQAIAVLSQVATMVVVTHFLLPDAVGIYVGAVSVVSAITFSGDLQFQASAIRASGDDHTLARTAGLLSLALGLIYAALILSLGSWAVSILGLSVSTHSLLQPIIRVSAVSPIVAALGAVPIVLLSRRLRLGDLARGRVVLAVGTALATSTLAFTLRTAWALPLGSLTAQVAQLCFLCWTVRRDWHALAQIRFPQVAVLRHFLGFGSSGFVLALLTFAGTNADNVTVARLFGATTLGAYALAYNLARSVDGNISVVVTRVLFPTLASDLRVGNSSALTVTVPSVLRVVTAISCAVSGLLFLTAPILVPQILGTVWQQVGTILQILALDGLFAPVVNILGNALLSAGTMRSVLAYTSVHVALMVGALLVLPSHFGIVGVALAELLGGAGATGAVCYLYGRQTGQPLRAIISGPMTWAACLLVTIGSYCAVRVGAMTIGWHEQSAAPAAVVGAILLVVSSLLAGRSAARTARTLRPASTAGAT